MTNTTTQTGAGPDRWHWAPRTPSTVRERAQLRRIISIVESGVGYCVRRVAPSGATLGIVAASPSRRPCVTWARRQWDPRSRVRGVVIASSDVTSEEAAVMRSRLGR
jgi:hypothetical protein